MIERQLFLAQRLTAMVLAPLVVIHLALIMIAVADGLTAEEILARTQSSIGWAVFYGLFVVAASIRAPIGLRNVLNEWTPIGSRWSNVFSIAFALLLLVLGLRAVIAVS